MTFLARVALLAGLALASSSATASTTSPDADRTPAAKAPALLLAQGMTPEGWRVEGPPRYKKARSNEVTKFREEPMHYKKKSTKAKSTTTGSGN